MNKSSALCLLLFLLVTPFSLAKAQSLEDYFKDFFQVVNEDWSRFELSIEISSDFESVIMELSETPGIEDLEVKTFVDEVNFENFLDDLFQTPYLIPHFCYNLKGFDSEQLWEMTDQQITLLCRSRTETLLKPLMAGDYVLRSFKVYGEGRRGAFYRAHLMVEDPRKEKSLVINFDVALDL